MIQQRLSRLSKNEAAFSRSDLDYNNALRASGHNNILKYEPQLDMSGKRKRIRKRKCLYFNAPYCQTVKNNLGKEFLTLVSKHFKKDHKLYKIFNRKTIKISYSCMSNMKNIIQGHNSKILNNLEHKEATDEKCNCRKKDQCPLKGRCQISNVVYKATIKSATGTRHYVGSTGGPFKLRYYNHMSSFKHEKKKFSTELSKYVWKIKGKNEDYNIEWKILNKIRQNKKKIQRICQTCNLERIAIALSDKRDTLNKRSELTGKCVHFQSLYF